MNTNSVLNLHFACDNGKKYNVRIKDADPAVTSERVKAAANNLHSIKFFDFDGMGSDYQLNSADYTNTDKRQIVAAPSTSRTRSRK